MHHQIYGFPPKKIQDQQNSSTHFVRWSSTKKKSAEILGPNVESAVVHYTKPEDEFRPGKGLNTKFRRDFFFSRSQVHNLCSGVPLKIQVRQNCLQSIEGTGSQKNLRLQCKVLNPRPYPTYWPWVAHVIGRNLPG